MYYFYIRCPLQQEEEDEPTTAEESQSYDKFFSVLMMKERGSVQDTENMFRVDPDEIQLTFKQ